MVSRNSFAIQAALDERLPGTELLFALATSLGHQPEASPAAASACEWVEYYACPKLDGQSIWLQFKLMIHSNWPNFVF